MNSLSLHDITWQLIRVATGDEFPAQVPGDNFSALIAAGVIPDPCVGTNETEVQWVSRETWAWSSEFTVSEAFLAHAFICLNADEIDTCATIEINGVKVGSTVSQFIRHRFDVKRALRAGTNWITVTIAPFMREAARRRKKSPIEIPSCRISSIPDLNFVRKSLSHAGMDFGPSLVVAGNGVDVFCKGTNWVPMDALPQRWSRDRPVVRRQRVARRAGGLLPRVTGEPRPLRRFLRTAAGRQAGGHRPGR